MTRSSRGAARHEDRHFRFADTNQRVASSTRELFVAWFPRALAPVVRYSIYALLDDEMIRSFGFPEPLPLTRPLLRRLLKLRGRAARWLPARRSPHFFTDDRNRTHSNGYRIAELGPPRLVEAERRRVPPDTPPDGLR